MFADGFIIEKATLARIGLLGKNDSYPYQLGFVSHHVNETSMRDSHKVLVIPLADVDLLLPTIILADDERPYLLLHKQINNPLRSRV